MKRDLFPRLLATAAAILLPLLWAAALFDRAVAEPAAPSNAAAAIRSTAPAPRGDVVYRISGPTTAAVSEMVVLTAEGVGADSVEWLAMTDDAFPQRAFDFVSDDRTTVERGKFLAFQMPAKSITWVAMINTPARATLKKWTVAVAGPKPPEPGPGPGPTPDPPKPPPIPGAGFRVLILEETADRNKDKAATDVIMSGDVRSYLLSHCAKGPDGKTPECRFLDDDLDPEADISGDNWKAAFKQATADSAGVRPWLIVSDGTKGESRKLPGSVAETLELLKKYGGP